jgi:enterochelin esterase-like enzyme
MTQTICKLDVENTRRLRDVLQAKGYRVKYSETHAGHCWSNWRSGLDDTVAYFFVD